MSRRRARILAFQALYAWDAGMKDTHTLLAFPWEEEKIGRMDEADAAYARALVAGTIEQIEDIDREISARLVGWELGRLRRVDLAILRISVYSLLFQKETPPGVVIEEAIAISRDYAEDSAFRFINGLLDNVRKSLDGKTLDEKTD